MQHQRDCAEGITAQLKKVVIKPYLRQLQRFFKGSAHPFFPCRHRLTVRVLIFNRLRHQRLLIRLAVGRLRHRGKLF